MVFMLFSQQYLPGATPAALPAQPHRQPFTDPSLSEGHRSQHRWPDGAHLHRVCQRKSLLLRLYRSRELKLKY